MGFEKPNSERAFVEIQISRSHFVHSHLLMSCEFGSELEEICNRRRYGKAAGEIEGGGVCAVSFPAESDEWALA